MSKLTDALDNFFAKAKVSHSADTLKVGGKTPSAIAALVTKTSVGLSNLMNAAIGSESEHHAATNPDKYASGYLTAKAVGRQLDEFHTGLGQLDDHTQMRTIEKADGSVELHAAYPLIIQHVSMTQYAGYADMLQHSDKCKVLGYRIVDFDRYVVHDYDGTEWSNRPFTNVNGLFKEFQRNAIYLSTYSNESSYIDSDGRVFRLW